MKKSIIVLIILALIVVASTVIFKSSSNVSTESEVSYSDTITEEDFDINYNGITINDRTPFDQITEKLQITIGESDENCYSKGSSNNDGNEYSWFVVHYPSVDNEDMQIEYLLNETDGSSYLISVDLFNGSTFRGVKVGDGINKLIKAYGKISEPLPNSSTTDFYSYVLADPINSDYDKEITVITVKSDNKIESIHLNYNNNRAFEDMDIPGFD